MPRPRPRFSVDRRRRTVVDRDLQVRLVASIVGAFLGSLLLFIAITLGFPLLLGAATGETWWGLEAFAFRLRLLGENVALPLLSAILVLFAVGVRATFGVAGPLYRFRQVFRDLVLLRLPRGVRIRKGDALQQTARLFDESLVALHDQIEKIQRHSKAALAEAESLADGEPHLAAQPMFMGELLRELQSLAAESERIKLLAQAPYAEEKAPAPPAPPMQLVP